MDVPIIKEEQAKREERSESRGLKKRERERERVSRSK